MEGIQAGDVQLLVAQKSNPKTLRKIVINVRFVRLSHSLWVWPVALELAYLLNLSLTVGENKILS
jgi:hypothetical protein